MRDQPGTQFRVSRTNGEMVVVSVNGVPTTSPELAGRFTIVPPGRIAEHGEPDVLYRNEGGGRFVAIPFTEGRFLDEDGKPLSAPPYDWGLSVTFRDLNGDGAPDLYVCNDFDSPDRIWMNNGRGGFRSIPRIALRNTSKFSMGVDVADVNRDGLDDILVLDMQSRSHVTRLTRADRMAEFSPIGSIEDRPQLPRNHAPFESWGWDVCRGRPLRRAGVE